MTTPIRSDFEALLDQQFEVEGGQVHLILRRVEPLPSSPREGGGFRLEFAGEQHLAQGTYALVCGDDRYDIFMVPIAQQGADTILEAIFN